MRLPPNERLRRPAAANAASLRPGFLSRFARHLSQCADFLLPPACAACGGPAAEELRAEAGPVCQNCRLGLPPVPHPACDRCGAPLGTGEAPSCLECADWPGELSSAHTLCVLESPARELVHALKYQGWRGVGEFMGVQMAWHAPDPVRRAQCVVPVPTSDRNIRRRGYNQAEVIAGALAGALGLPLHPCLKRRRQRGTQTSLNPMERRANVSDAFVVAESLGGLLRGRRVVLVDDVITTGATILAAVRALGDGAPESTVGYAFARTVPMSLEVT